MPGAIAVLTPLLFLASLTIQSPQCADATSCRQAALDAASREDFETFHDLAWRAAQKGRPNDPELMSLVARAQSLSGRPGDALVMLRRLAQMGVATDAASSEDFRRVRALPGWPEIEALLAAGATSPGPGTRSIPPAAAPIPAPAAARAEVAARTPAGATTDEALALPLALASIQPAGLSYDGVSRRFIVGDRRENKLIIFDDVFKRATDMVGADSAGFFGLVAIEIDRRRGDLWVANSSAGHGASVHKLQLVSGRVLYDLTVPTELGPTTFVDVAALPDGRVLLLDTQGRRLLRLSPGRRSFERAAGVDVEGATSLAAAGEVVYVAHPAGIVRVDIAARASAPVRGAPAGLLRIRGDGGALIGVHTTTGGQRIIRLRLDARGRKVVGTDVLDASATMPDPSAITIADGVVYYITSANGVPVIRRVKARR